MLSRRIAGAAQKTRSLWREGVRPDKGHFGYDKSDKETFPEWYTPMNAEWYHVEKDEATMRDRLCGVKLNPGQYTTGGAGKLSGWVLVNRTGSVVVRNPYNNLMDDLGPLRAVEQCEESGWKKSTMFKITAGTGVDLYTTLQGLLSWSYQDHWHPKLMRSTWNNNGIDVFNALQVICKDNNPSYEPVTLDLSNLPVIKFTEGHPSLPRWKLPHYPKSRKPIDKIETGWDDSEWNWHPSPFGQHKANPAYYPEFRGNSKTNSLDQHLQSFGRHPHNMHGTRGKYTGFGHLPGPSITANFQSQHPDSHRPIPQSTGELYRTWAMYETKTQSVRFNGSKESTVGPWPFAQPVRDRLNNPVALPT
eukprot:TRINITY_DN37283_c0_g1_i1.p1 TRINITY_DN37283_c0_g1~~TRINITY_DN37283_c0_g1_i1.p1  ORF type:complete len:361 (+),score=44.52 TRINITY_DN37283_c0_g1_i1:55-1137(+)